MNKLKYHLLSEIFMISLAVLCFSYALYISLRYANQVPLDLFSFRQSQTALTSFWLVRNGFSLAYETPVVGPPWSIPFEFPIYQYIVALASQITNSSLNATGRAVSFFFLALCLIPVRVITKKLKLDSSVFYIFVSLLFSSPLYLYWGRSFMIETTALFFTLAAIKYFIDIVNERNSTKYLTLFLVFMTLSVLQKSTTGLPVLVVLSFVYIFLVIKETNSLKSALFSKNTMLALVYFGIPLVIGIAWVQYTDQIKSLNSFGLSLTSSSLAQWNWGTLDQRLSFEIFYRNLILGRIFDYNLSGPLGLAVLVIAFGSSANRTTKLVVLTSLIMGLLPLFLFPNLHIRHSYYQTANLIFFIYAISVCIGQIFNNFFEKKLMLISLVIIMVANNYLHFSIDDFDNIKKEFNRENSRDYAIAEILKNSVPQDKYFVAFGNDYSSTWPYLAERKAYSVSAYKEKSFNPEQFIEKSQLGGVVLCPSADTPTTDEFIQWVSIHWDWKVITTHGCYIAVL